MEGRQLLQLAASVAAPRLFGSDDEPIMVDIRLMG